MALSDTNVLITGADGFIGSHLAEALVPLARKVRALALYNSWNSWGWLDTSPCLKDLEIVCGDIRDPACCREITQGVDVVFHLAALVSIPYSYRAPNSYLETNVNGTFNICQAALGNGCKRVVHTSTSEVYGTARYVPIDEEHALQPQSPYSASKIAADMLALSFYNAFGLPVVVARPFNTYGPRQSARAVVPTLITQILSGARKLRLGDLRPTRDFSFVTDTCRGLIILAECEAALGQVLNIGSNSEISIGELASLIKRLMGADTDVALEPERLRPATSEVFRLRCDNSRIRRLAGYAPQVLLEEGLRLTIEWLRRPENLARYKPELYNV